MTADQTDDAHRIIAFAAKVGGAETPPEAKARRRGWLDENGVPTADGRALLDSIADQSNTRTVFRGL